MYLNKVMLIGNLTRDPELRQTQDGTAVCSFGLATNEKYKDKNGTTQEITEFHNVVVWGAQGENVAKYMRKGSQVYVEGKLRTTSWEQDGIKKYKTEVVASRVQFGYNKVAKQPEQEEPAQAEATQEAGDLHPDDIPF